MSYNHKTNSQTIVLILLTVLIFLRFLQYKNWGRKNTDDRLITAKVQHGSGQLVVGGGQLLIKRYNHHCFYFVNFASSQLADQSRLGLIVPHCQQYRLGSVLEVTGSLNDSSANQSKQLKILSHPTIKLKKISFLSPFLNLREKIAHYFQFLLGDPEGNLFFSLMFGDQARLTPMIKQEANILSLNHLLAVSGLHLVILVGLCWRWLRYLPRVIGLTMLSLLIFFYLALSLFKPSTLRAGGMILSLFWSRQFLFRSYRSFFSLGLIFGLILLVQPGLIESISLQLSFLATAGILFLHSMQKRQNQLISLELVDKTLFILEKKKRHLLEQMKDYLWASLKISLVVEISIFPLIINYFHAFSLWSLLSTALFLWLLVPIFLSGLVLLSLSPLIYFGWFGWTMLQTLALVFSLPLKIMLWLMNYLARFDSVYYQFPQSVSQLTFIWYTSLGFLLSIYFLLRYQRSRWPRSKEISQGMSP